jgi:hypothetical protein
MPASGILQWFAQVSFNPLKRVEPVGTILLPGILLLMRSAFIMLFGWRSHWLSGRRSRG